jgi:hypothetical protein
MRFTVNEGKQHRSCLFPWEPGGSSEHQVKVESYKEFAGCMGSKLPWMHLAMQTNKEIGSRLQEQIKELMHASIQVQCAHFSGAESICIMLMEEQIKETTKEVNHW